MQRVLLIKDDWGRRSLCPRPEGIALRGDHVEGEVEKKLLDVVVEQLFESVTSPRYAISKRLGPVSHQILAHPPGSRPRRCWLLGQTRGECLWICNVPRRVLHCLLEAALKVIPGPLDSVFNQVWKVLERADRDALLRGVARRAVGLGLVRYHHLESTGLIESGFGIQDVVWCGITTYFEICGNHGVYAVRVHILGRVAVRHLGLDECVWFQSRGLGIFRHHKYHEGNHANCHDPTLRAVAP